MERCLEIAKLSTFITVKHTCSSFWSSLASDRFIQSQMSGIVGVIFQVSTGICNLSSEYKKCIAILKATFIRISLLSARHDWKNKLLTNYTVKTWSWTRVHILMVLLTIPPRPGVEPGFKSHGVESERAIAQPPVAWHNSQAIIKVFNINHFFKVTLSVRVGRVSA